VAYKSEHITQQLREARERAAMSQRELSERSGLTQSHISQIERGGMEPGLSSLIDLARALDLEVVLAPKKLVPAIRNVIQSAPGSNASSTTAHQRKQVERFERLVIKQKQLHGASAELDTIADSLRLLRHLPLNDDEFVLLQSMAARLNTYQAGPQSRPVLKEIAQTVKKLRNLAVHRDHGQDEARAAYALDEEDDNA
jgi:transcriptional regulator with XRE-family HTH domain